MTEAKPDADVEGSAIELSLDAAVVSLSAIADAATRLDGVRRLTVRRKAIVTPAVRDLLRQRKIELAFRTEGSAKQNNVNGVERKNAALRLMIGVTDTRDSQVDALVKLLARGPLAVERLAPAGLLETIDQLASLIAAPATVGLLLCGEPAAAACLTNRLAGVRAMTAADGAALAGLGATARAIGANLLIIDPAGRSPFAVKPWIDRFCQGAPRSCPPQWRGRLD